MANQVRKTIPISDDFPSCHKVWLVRWCKDPLSL